mmetsp:Transcript_26335/g.58947  ORF Transcript_26335/g.58947 Transcript_26335/m.58947 type:complete len:198 (-) Transcript_26335:442-1035(-)
MGEFDLVKWLVAGIAAFGVNYFRNGFAAIFISGSIVNSFACKLLKRLFNQPRPAGAAGQGLPDPGMPSSHAHMLFFLTAYFGLHARSRADDSGSPFMFAACASLAIAILSCCHRVASGKHSRAQVLVGALTGLLGGVLWRHTFGDAAIQATQEALNSLRNSPYSRAELPCLLTVEAIGLFFLTGGGRRLSMRGKKTT